MAVEFSVRTESDLRASKELGRCSQGVAFRDIRRDGERCTSDLVDECKVLAQTRVEREQVGAVRYVLGDVPGIKTRELSHAVTMGRGASPDGTEMVHLVGDFTHPASRIPHPASGL